MTNAAGQIRVRIYRPEIEGVTPALENKGEDVDFAKYPFISLDYLPDGEEQPEFTTFIGERDVESFANAVQYPVIHGDGPTNLHDRSFLFNDSRTESWTRGDHTGSITEIAINEIFREYQQRSNVIRGTQRCAGLFDRYFAEFGEAYTPISGTYDERMCFFNGQNIQIQAGDVHGTIREITDRPGGSTAGGSGGREVWNRWVERLLAIGILAEDIDREERTAILCELDNPIRRGLTYWVVNSNELSEEDRWAGIYPFVPILVDEQGNPVEDEEDDTVVRYGPGLISVPIESGFFSAPAGSMIVKAPGQDETESGETDEDIEDIFIDVEAIDKRVKEGEDALDHLENVQMPLLEQQLLELEDELADLNNIILPELEDKIDNLNDVQLPALQSQITALDDSIDDLNDVVIPNLNSELNTLDGYFNDPSSIPSNYDFFTGIVANNGFINSLVTRDLFTDNLAAKNAFVNQIVANNAFIDSLTSRDLFTDNLVANNGFINELVANNTFTNNLAAKNAFVNRVVANDAFINTLTSRDLFTDNLTAKTAWVNDMTAAIINVGDLYSRNATIRGHLTVGTSSVAGQISVVGAGTIVVDSNGRIRLNSNGSLEVGNNGNVRINSGGTISIGSGSTFTMGTGAQMNIGNRIFIGQNLSSFEADNRVFIGNWSNSESAGNIRPIVQVRQNDDNYVLMFARPYGSGDPFFTVRAGGQDVLTAGTGGVDLRGGLVMQSGAAITTGNNTLVLDYFGLKFPNAAQGDTRLGLEWGSDGTGINTIFGTDQLQYRSNLHTFAGTNGSITNSLLQVGRVRLTPRTTAQMDGISNPGIGTVIYNSTAQRIAFFTGSGGRNGWHHVQAASDRF